MDCFIEGNGVRAITEVISGMNSLVSLDLNFYNKEFEVDLLYYISNAIMKL